tara:strand:- start:5 stop:361 length:357 start_codon:yes stop_codon:yes gene_type:complete
MQTFFIFTKKKHPIKVMDCGFSKISFILGLFWGLNKELWAPVMINFSLILILSLYSPGFIIGFILISNIFWGFFGKDLLIQKYLKKNYSPQNIINASSKETALLIYQAKSKNEVSFNN